MGWAEQTAERHFGTRFGYGLITGEATHDFQSPRRVQPIATRWQLSPPQGEISRQRSSMASCVGESGELLKQLPLDPQLIAQPAAEFQVPFNLD